MTKAEILARLQNGESMDNIAAEISTMMTEAEDEFKTIKEAEEKEKAETEEKIVAADQVADVLNAFAETYYKIEEPLFDSQIVLDIFDGYIKIKEDIEKPRTFDFTNFFNVPFGFGGLC